MAEVLARVDIYSHNFKVSGFGRSIYLELLDFCRPLMQMEFNPKKPASQRAVTAIFAAANKDRTEFRFHRSLLEKFWQHLSLKNFRKEQFTVTVKELRPPKPLAILIKEHIELRDYQIPVVDFILEPEKPIRLCALQTGKGKAISLETLVKVPGGWRVMRDIHVGDDVVARDGTFTKVIGEYPQEAKQLYWVEFEDGRKVEVCGEHLWKVWTENAGWHVTDTKKILDTMSGTSEKFAIPVCSGGEDQSANAFELWRLMETPKVKIVEDYKNDPHYIVHDQQIAERLVYLLRSGGNIAAYNPETKILTTRTASTLGISSITPSRIDVSKCIAVDHPEHLFIVQDFIVTHNTLCGLYAASRHGTRFAVVVPGMYTDKWYSDVLESFNANADDILFVRGLKALFSAVAAARVGTLTQSVILISSTTLQLFFTSYEANPQLTIDMCCHPEDLWEELGVGFRIIDEVHRPCHLNYKIDLYTHIEKALYLSATPDSKDHFLTSRRLEAYPLLDRFKGLAYDQYIEVHAIEYSLRAPAAVKYKNRKGQYSHVVFEQYLMRNPKIMERYIEMILDTLHGEWYCVREPGMRGLVFASSVEFCTILQKRIAQKYPHFKVGRYVGEDEYEILMSSDITVSTVLSAGTAVDIAGLSYCLLTTSVDSSISNEQALGRLRRLKDWPNWTPLFSYFFCRHIDKQVAYHKNKLEFFTGKAKVHNHYISAHSV